ncbi:MAG: site-2 protease family protein [Planctomycetaceae bacterium]|nr:site-2 protease family protein [Planctomycetaceae bacterium]
MAEQVVVEQKNVKNKNLINAFILVVLVGMIAYFISKNFNKSSSIILSFVGLGVVIFIHEFGHFAAGKLCGIKVEAFAIGFGTIIIAFKKIDNFLQIRILPTILEKHNDPDQAGLLCVKIPMNCKAGETEYQLRVFPVGGFVKLMGQEDLGADKKCQDPRAFTNVAIWKRIVAVSAGVTLNIVLAAILFVIVFMRGINLPPAIVGDVMPGYPAYNAGLKVGDEILAVNGKSNLDFMGIAFEAALIGKDKPVSFKVKRTDGSVVDMNIVPTRIAELGIKGVGIGQPSTLEVAKVADVNALEAQYGVLPGDVLAAVDGQPVEQFWQFSEKLDNSFEPNVTVAYKRAGQDALIEKKLLLEYSPVIVYREDTDVYVPSHIYGLVPRLKIYSVQTPEANEAFRQGDIIVQAGEIANPNYKQLRELTTASLGQEMTMVVLRGGESVEVKISPKKSSDGRAVLGIVVMLDVENAFAAQTTDANTYAWSGDLAKGAQILSIAGKDVKNYFDIANALNANCGKTVKVKYEGVLDNEETSFAVPADGNPIQARSQIVDAPPFKMLKTLYRATGPGDAIKKGSRKTLEFVGQTYMTIKGLIVRDISPKSLMGPIGMIAASTKIISDRDFMQYFYFMGMISACLAVMNFLPLPIFDGGLVVLLIIEKIIGRPVNEKVQEVLVYIGLVGIIGLVIVVCYNDILRWFLHK